MNNIKSSEDKRNYRIAVLCSEKEYNTILSNQKKNGSKNPGSYLRELGLQGKKTAFVKKQEFFTELTCIMKSIGDLMTELSAEPQIINKLSSIEGSVTKLWRL